MHVYVDESERGAAYLLCAVAVHPAGLLGARRCMRQLCRPGQRRVHMVKERDPRRREILSAIAALELRARVYRCRGRAVAARRRLLPELVSDLADTSTTLLVLESQHDNGQDHRDRATIRQALLDGCGPAGLTYEHLRAAEEPLLWVADAMLWAYGLGGDWRRRVDPLVDKVVDLG